MQKVDQWVVLGTVNSQTVTVISPLGWRMVFGHDAVHTIITTEDIEALIKEANNDQIKVEYLDAWRTIWHMFRSDVDSCIL